MGPNGSGNLPAEGGGGLKIWLCGDSLATLLYITSNCLSSLLSHYIGRNRGVKFRGFSAMIGPFRVALVFRGGWWWNFRMFNQPNT